MKKLSLLVIAPHPDDEILGCGGTIIKANDAGHEVHIVYLSSGDSNQPVREKEARNVCQHLKITNHHFLRLLDNTFTVDAASINKLLNIFKTIQPDIVFAPHKSEGDTEHEIAYRLVNTVFGRYNDSVELSKRPQSLLLYEIHRPMEKYNLVEDISEVMQQKLNAMQFYKSQLKITHLDLAIKGLNRYRGSMHEGLDYAEVFNIKKFRSLFPES